VVETAVARESWTIGNREVIAEVCGTMLDDYKGASLSLPLWCFSVQEQVQLRSLALAFMEAAYPDCEVEHSGATDGGRVLLFHIEPREE